MFSKKIIITLKNTLTVGTVVALVFILVALIFISFLKSSINSDAKSLEQANQLIQGRTNILEQHFALKKQSDEATVLEKRLKARLSSRDDLLQLSREFGEIAKITGVDVNPSFIGEASNTDTDTLLGRTGISLTVDGKLLDILRFLEGVEKSRFLISLNNFDITSQSQDKMRFFARGEVIYRN